MMLKQSFKQKFEFIGFIFVVFVNHFAARVSACHRATSSCNLQAVFENKENLGVAETFILLSCFVLVTPCNSDTATVQRSVRHTASEADSFASWSSTMMRHELQVTKWDLFSKVLCEYDKMDLPLV